MSLSILNNISSLNAQNSISLTQANLQKTLIQLSSGLRVNSGADDAAGLSIANGLSANISALTQSGQNATNTTGLLQTADSALSQVTSLLNRAITLATEASSNGLSASQTAALNNEYTSILGSINNIGNSTNFNGKDVFTTNAVTPFLSDGTSGNDLLGTTAITVGTLTTTGLGLGSGGSAPASASDTLTLAANPTSGTVTVGTQTYTLTSGALSAGKVAIGSDAAHTLANLAAAIAGDSNNTANASATASASGSTLTITAKAAGALGNGVTTTSALVSGAANASWSNTGTLSGGLDATSAQFQVATSNAVPSPGDSVTIGTKIYTFATTLDGTTANQVSIGADMYSTMVNLADAVNQTNNNGSEYNTSTQKNTDFQSGAALGSPGPGNASIIVTAIVPGTAGNLLTVASSSLFHIPLSLGANATPATDTATFTAQPLSGDTLAVGGATYAFGTATGSQIAVTIGGNLSATMQNLYNAINAHNTAVPSYGVSASAFNGTSVTVSSAGAAGNSVPVAAASAGGASWSSSTGTAGGASGGAITDLNTPADAQAALVAVTNAINTVSQSRGSLGADINQLTAASNVMISQVQNLQSANNGLVNADIGKTVASMTQYNVLQSTGMSALQQANQAQQAVLKLLQ